MRRRSEEEEWGGGVRRRSKEEVIHSIELGVGGGGHLLRGGGHLLGGGGHLLGGGGHLYLKILVSAPGPFEFWALGFEVLGFGARA